MQELGWASLEVIPTVKGFDSKLSSQTNPLLARAGTKGGLTFGNSAGKSMTHGFLTHAKAAAIGAGAILGGVAAIGIKFGKDSLQGYEDHLRVVGITKSAIKATGGAANITAKQVGNLTDSLERQTGVDGDLIQQGANMLLTFKNVRNDAGKNNDIFNQSVSILTDMSTAMGTDAKSSAIQLGKALNDPVKGITALSRVGVTFDDQQKKQIANFVKQGQAANAQKIILKELSSEFGGAAKAQETMGDRVLVSYHALQDEVGKALLPEVKRFERFLATDGIPAAEHYFRVFKREGIPQVKTFVHEAEPLVKSILPAIGTGFKDVAGFLKDAAPYAKKTIDAFNSVPDWAQKSIVLGVGATALAKKTGVLSIGKNLLSKAGSGGGGIVSAIKGTPADPVFVVVTNPSGGLPGVGGGGAKGPLGDVPKGARWLPMLGQAGVLGFALAVDVKGGQTAFNDVRRSASRFGFGQSAPTAGGNETQWQINHGPHLDFGKMMMEANGSFKSATNTVDALNASLAKTSRGIDLVGTRGGKSFATLTKGGGEYKALLSTLPNRVQTAILAPGMVKTQGDIDALRKKYGLTPRQVKTAVELTGISEAKRRVDEIRAYAGRHIPVELSIELAPRRGAALDNVRRP